MNFRLATPAVLVDLNALSELAYISDGPDGLRMGGMTRQRAVERSPVVASEAPLRRRDDAVHRASRRFATEGTIGGSLAHADPAAELPAVMLALNARFGLRSSKRARARSSADDFFVGPLRHGG